MMQTHSTHPDEEDSSPNKWISVGDTKVIDAFVFRFYFRVGRKQ